MLHELLVNASDLDKWAIKNESAAYLPTLIRRLVLATAADASRVDVPTEESIYFGGWDAIVEARVGNAFVPAGLSAWEMGKDAKPKSKADADYAKRSLDPCGIDPATTTFVFVTP